MFYLCNMNPKINQSVSILTVTQRSRFASLLILKDIILRQDYPSCLITEWIIVEGSKNEEDATQSKENIEKMAQDLAQVFTQDMINVYSITKFIDDYMIITHLNQLITIKYISYDPNRCLSDHRNIGNDNVSDKSDIIVCMDDDDYYQDCYISHIVSKLSSSKKQIAGCSGAFMYQYEFNQLYKFKSFGPNHSTNNCLAYTSNYLKSHRYQSGLHFAEETSFTNGFSEPMVQLNPNKCIVISSHGTNTVDKKHFCTNVKQNKSIRESNLNICSLIHEEIFVRLNKVFESKPSIK